MIKPLTHSADRSLDVNPELAAPSDWMAGLKQGVLIAGAVLALLFPPAQLASTRVSTSKSSVGDDGTLQVPRYADFLGEAASDDVRFIANWVADSRDNRELSFVIIDKKHTRVFVFDASAKLIGATPVLLGAAAGDDSVTGIGKRPIEEVQLQERTTPAGRFIAEPGRNTSGEDVVWVDYDAAVSMHRVRIVDQKERRLERLATPTSDDNRISFGCVNIPVPFFENVLSPQFKARYGVVYVLPEVKELREVFAAAYDHAEKRGWARSTAQAPAKM